MKKALLTGLVGLILFVPFAWAGDVPQLLNYQGRLTDSSGIPLEGSHSLTFNLYNAVSGGTVLWGPQTFSSVAFSNGHFNVILSSDTRSRSVTTAFSGASAYMAISVDGANINPRQQILSAPYAVSAQNAKHADNATQALNSSTANTVADNGIHAYKSPILNNVSVTIPSSVSWDVQVEQGCTGDPSRGTFRCFGERSRSYTYDIPNSNFNIDFGADYTLGIVNVVYDQLEENGCSLSIRDALNSSTTGALTQVRKGVSQFKLSVTCTESQSFMLDWYYGSIENPGTASSLRMVNGQLIAHVFRQVTQH